MEGILKKFILSDLHIGHKDAQYNAMDEVIAYIRKEAKPGDEISGHSESIEKILSSLTKQERQQMELILNKIIAKAEKR